MKDRPDIVEDIHLTYLDNLRESGATNMFGAAPFLMDQFALSSHSARAVLSYWMGSFGERHDVPGERPAK